MRFIIKVGNFFSIALIALLGLFQTSLFAEDLSYWIKSDWSPVYIMNGKYKDEGMGDKITQLFQREMPDVNFSVKWINSKRRQLMMQTGKKGCDIAMVKTPEREKFMVFSVATVFSPSHRIIFNETPAMNWKKGKAVSLESLLKNKIILGHLVKGRSYGKKLDTIIKQFSTNSKIYWEKSEGNASVFKMLEYNRLDYTLEYPFIAQYQIKEEGVSVNLGSLQIKEHSSYIYGRMGCPKNTWGKKMVKRVNKILKKKRKTAEYKNILTQWVDGSSATQMMRDYQLFLNQD